MTEPTSIPDEPLTAKSPAVLRKRPVPRKGRRRVAWGWPLVPFTGTALALLGYFLPEVSGVDVVLALVVAMPAVLFGTIGWAVALFAAANDDDGPVCYSLLPDFVRNISVVVCGISALVCWLASPSAAWLFIAGFSGLCALETLRNVFVRYRV